MDSFPLKYEPNVDPYYTIVCIRLGRLVFGSVSDSSFSVLEIRNHLGIHKIQLGYFGLVQMVKLEIG